MKLSVYVQWGFVWRCGGVDTALDRNEKAEFCTTARQGWQTSWCRSRKELSTETNPVGLQPVLDTGWEDVRLAKGGGAEREVMKTAFL